MKQLRKALGMIGTVIVIVVASIIGRGLGRSNGHIFTNAPSVPSTPTIEEQLQQTSDEMNSKLPTMSDKYTRLDTTFVGPGRKWTYMYTLVSNESLNLTQQDIDAKLAPYVRKGVCTSETMQAFVKNDVDIVYLYRASNGKTIGQITVTPSDCDSLN